MRESLATAETLPAHRAKCCATEGAIVTQGIQDRFFSVRENRLVIGDWPWRLLEKYWEASFHRPVTVGTKGQCVLMPAQETFRYPWNFHYGFVPLAHKKMYHGLLEKPPETKRRWWSEQKRMCIVMNGHQTHPLWFFSTEHKTLSETPIRCGLCATRAVYVSCNPFLRCVLCAHEDIQIRIRQANCSPHNPRRVEINC